jgi:molybdopterin-containing oxidoreductase family membrane subunit
VGTAAFLWRLALTTGTGSIFGFLVARHGFDSALLAPTFVALSLSYGTAIFLLVLMAAGAAGGRSLGDAWLARLARLQAIFVAAGLYFVAVQHLTGLYSARRIGFEQFILLGGGACTAVFWLGQVLLGGVLPLALLLRPRAPRRAVALGALAVVLGGLAQMYVTIVGGQAYPLQIFPGFEVRSSFQDGVVAAYAPSLPEWLLGLGGAALAALIVLVGLRLLAFVPERLDEAAPAAAAE